MHIYKIQTSKLNHGILNLTLMPSRNKDRVEFEPGQYAAISYRWNYRRSAVRCFSITNSPNINGKLEFSIRCQGDYTKSLASLKTGSKIYVSGAYGTFTVNEHYDTNMVMLAGGIGITPFMSMIRSSSELGLPNRMVLLYSNSSEENIPFHDELREHERVNPRFSYASFITQGKIDRLSGQRAIAGRIETKHLEQLTKGRYDMCTYYICGPREFIKSYTSILKRNKVPAEKIVSEEFSPTQNLASLVIPRERPSRLAYALTAASLVIGVGFIGALDMARYLPAASAQARAVQASQTKRLATQPAYAANTSASASSSSSTQSTSSSPVTSVTPSSTQASPASSPSQSASSASTPAAASTQTQPVQQPAPAPAPVQTYQPPVSSVS